MTRHSVLALVAVLVLAAPVLAAEGEGKFSGRLIEIRAEGKLMIEEQGPWLGPGTGLVTRAVELTPGTSIQVVRPTGTWTADASPGYEIQAADFTVLKPGDFVTVTTGSSRSTALSLEVMRLEGTEGLASPRPAPGR